MDLAEGNNSDYVLVGPWHDLGYMYSGIVFN